VHAEEKGPVDGNGGVGAAAIRDAALVAAIGLDRFHASQWQMVAGAVARTSRPVLIAAGMAAVTAIVTVIHLTGYVPAVGATTGLPGTLALLAPRASD
jgi:hypothetical protein